MENLSIIVAFTGGVVSFFSPCIVPVIPGYFASLAGTAAAGSSSISSYRLVFPHAFSFVLGFSIVFVVLGAALGLAGSVLSDYVEVLRKLMGAIVVLFGLQMLGILKFPFLYREKHVFIPGEGKISYSRSFLTGTAFSLGWTPCVSLVLSGILALAWTGETAWKGVTLLLAYSLGLGIPFLVIGLFVSSIGKYLARLSRLAGVVSRISGVMLIALGVLIFLDKLSWLSSGVF